MTVTEGGGRRAIIKKFEDVYLGALKANFMVWPAVQILNFRLIPRQFQIVSHVNKNDAVHITYENLYSLSSRQWESSGLRIFQCQIQQTNQSPALHCRHNRSWPRHFVQPILRVTTH
jgi:hypothetical protein